MTSEQDRKWRLESFDVRAGLAFAAWRGERNAGSDGETEDWPCLFFGAPTFIAEPVDNVALAMGASRGSFQPGLFIEGREAFFDTPEVVAEFVRRAYVGSAGGDEGGGGGAGGDGGPPVGPADPQDLPGVDTGDGIFWDESFTSGVLYQGARSFSSRSALMAFGQASPFSWESARGRHGVEPLAAGALEVMREMLLRSSRAADATLLLRWHEDLRMLGGCIGRMGLWPELQMGRFAGTCRSLLESFRVPGWDGESLDAAEKAHLLFGDGPTLDDHPGIMRLREYIRFFGPPFGWAGLPIVYPSTDDHVELLRRLPVPSLAASLVSDSPAQETSLYHALAAFIASPQAVLRPKVDPDAIHVMLFASACVVTCGAHPADRNPLQRWGPSASPPTPMQRAAIQRVADDAAAWLLEQLPRVAYSPDFELAIAAGKTATYGLSTA